MTAGARVIMACRDMVKAEQAACDILREVENATVVTCKLDLADTKSICDFAELIYNSELGPEAIFCITNIYSLTHTSDILYPHAEI